MSWPNERDVAVALRHVAEQGADQRALAHAVAPEQADGLAARDVQVDAVQHVAEPYQAWTPRASSDAQVVHALSCVNVLPR